MHTGLAWEADVCADLADPDTWIAWAAAATDATANGAERDVGSREKEAGAERPGSKQLEELSAGRALSELPGDRVREIHLGRHESARRLVHRRAGTRLVAGMLPRLARHREVREAIAGRIGAAGGAVALRAAEPAPGSRAAREAAEPLAAGAAAGGAAAADPAALADIDAAGHRAALTHW